MKNILIVDDEQINRYLLKHYVLNKNINIFEAGNGKEALKIFNEEQIDLIFMDIMMPVMDGIDATIEIKKINPELPVIAISAHLDLESDKLNCFDIKLSKPINKKIFNNIIKQFL